jgi:hypothetical protein
MNRIKFDAKILDLYSVDYEYLQDSIEDEVAKLLRQTMSNPGQAGIIKGFKLKASPSDSSKIMIYSDGTWNSAVSNDGIMVEIEDDIDLIPPSASNVLNYIYVRSYTADGTYNKTADIVEEGVQKAIDYYDYARVYDRQLDTWVIEVYTLAEYLNLTTAQQYALIYVGSFLATTPVSAISTSGRSDVKTFIADGSVTTNSISSTDMLLPQAYVDNSAIIYDTYAYSTFTPENLEEDLNKIRSLMRSIRGTAVWDEYDTNNLKVFDSSISALHNDGVFKDVLEELDVLPNSTGLSVIVVSGKALITGVLQSISDLSHRTIDIVPQPSYYVAIEDHYVATKNVFVDLDYQNVEIISVKGGNGGSAIYYPGINGYIVYASTGQLYIPSTSNIETGDPTRPIYVEYNYGFVRYDVISIGPNLDIAVAQGESEVGNGPPSIAYPPVVPVIESGYVPLAVIKVVPNIYNFEYAHIHSYKRFTPWMRDLEFIPCDSTSIIQTSINRISYHKADTVIDTSNNFWSSHINPDNGMTYYQTNTTNTFITTAVMCTEDDEVWLLVDKSIEENDITVEWNISPEDTAYDTSTRITLDLQWRYPLHYYPIKVTKGLSTGIHKFKITKVTATNPFNFYGVLVGKPDTYYQNYSQTELETYFSRFLAEDTTKNIAIGLNNLPSDNNGSNLIAIGDSTLGLNTTGDDDIAIGTNALASNLTGINNIAIDTDALKLNTQGNNNLAFGVGTLNANTTGDDNLAFGTGALGKNVGGDSNIAVGSGALAENTSGSDNIVIGNGAGDGITSVSGTIVIGNNLAGANAANRTYIDNIYDDAVTLPNINAAPNVTVDINGRLQKVTYPGTPPIGSIIAWLPGYCTGSGTGAYIALNPEPTLPLEWVKCNGNVMPLDTDSPLFNGNTPSRYAPDLTNYRFLTGSTAANSGLFSGNNDGHSHSFSLSTPSGGEHTHFIATGNSVTSYGISCAGSPNNNHAVVILPESQGYALHSHTVTGTVGTTAYGLIGDAAGSNMPKYLSVQYIMRIK